ncbi:PRD domain-containing protein [Enterococcus sp. 079]|nr:PRD domain-containing protein [Enterococcus sp. 079]
MKVLRLVQKAVKELEKLMGIEFSNNQLFLLYMHCCSMIERILRKESVDEQADIKEYIQKRDIIMKYQNTRLTKRSLKVL